MEDLFSTNITIDSSGSICYKVIFDNEKYMFIPGLENTEFSTFSFRRENDAWYEEGSVPEDIKNQAIEALENYLLKQH